MLEQTVFLVLRLDNAMEAAAHGVVYSPELLIVSRPLPL